MSLWWLGGLASSSTTASEVNAPSLWSGGVTWEAAAADTGTQAYWQTSAAATARTGEPVISIAVGGALVLNVCRSASWSLGRDQWLSVLAPASASLEFNGAVAFAPMTDVVIGVMSDVTDQHSDSLWVGYVDTISETTETSGRITTSVNCVDVVGLLGQATAAAEIPFGGTLAEFMETVSANTDVEINVDDGDLPAAFSVAGNIHKGQSFLEAVNMAEQGANALLMLQGSGRLRAAYRQIGDAPTPTDLDSVDPPSTWTTQLAPTSVVNEWLNEDGDSFGTYSIGAFGRRSQTVNLEYAFGGGGFGAYVDLLVSEVMLAPRSLLTSATTPITDLGQPTLFLDPLDYVTLGGDDWQVMAVQHSVEPGRRWTVTFSGDLTLNALLGA